MDSEVLGQEEGIPEGATREAATSNGELDFHPNSVDLKSNGSLENPVASPSSASEKPVDSKKGKGLKKWRRFKRDFIKEGWTKFANKGSPPDLSYFAQLAQMNKRHILLPDSSRSGQIGDEKEDIEGESLVASVELRTYVIE